MSGDDPEKTIYIPATGFGAGNPPGDGSLPGASIPPAPPVAAPLPAGGAQAIKVGDVLNHLYQVHRQIARGGMGEVFEGANVNYAEERVAIKVILPHLAADPAVQGMFFKEARTLTRLNHPALVQYRTMAQEPQLGVFYIVTEFVDGPNLSDKLKDLNADAKQIASLAKRLAEGLSVAHSMGAIHRDISPDNILLEGGSVDRAKIIDFGIAKDLDPTAATIVGDGFAGKLNYVAPEQLGEHGRNIGPWTDIYSLGLTILAVARGRDVDMGGTIVDAVDKRRAGPDLSPVPDGLRPLIARMVAANPDNRIQSMDEVVRWLDDWSRGKAPAATGSASLQTAGKKVADQISGLKTALAKQKLPPFLKEPRGMAIAGGGAVALLLLVAVILSMSGGSSDDTQDTATAETAVRPPATAAPADPLAATRTVLTQGLPKVPCSWLDIEAIDGGAGAPVVASLKGVSGQSTQAIATIEQMLRAAGLGSVSVKYDDIAPVPANFCGPVEAFTQIRGGGAFSVTTPQLKFEMSPLDATFASNEGLLAAMAVIDIDLKGSTQMPAVVGIDETGAMQLLEDSLIKVTKPIREDLGNGRYRLNLPTTNSGWSGIVLINGNGPFQKKIFDRAPGTIDSSWTQQFTTAARQGGWKAEMVWYKAVNDQPDAPVAN